jgi:hypothetical protein
MMVHNYHVLHKIHIFPPIEPQPMGNIIPRFLDFDESPINEFNTTLEPKNLHANNHLLLKIWLLNIIIQHQIDARCNENYIITYTKLVPIPKKCVIHDNIVMFHV